HSLVYRSVASESFTISQIYSMLSKAKDYNNEHGITGCLLFHNNRFLQLLEGKEKEVMNLFQKISLDKRHQDIQMIESNFILNRVFDSWSMAFHDYGQNGLSANLKFGQIDSFLQRSGAFNKSSQAVLKFFGSVREVLFVS
ncbi:MAG: BLUF domain-containing protein, partial [Bacteroidota bacterium]